MEEVNSSYIKKLTARRFLVAVGDLEARGNQRDLFIARGIAMKLIRDRMGLSYTRIGRQFGGRDHSTVRSAINRIQTHFLNIPDIVDAYVDIKSSFPNT